MTYNLNSQITIVEYLMLEDIQENVGLQEGINIFFNTYKIHITLKLKLNLLHLKNHSGYRQKHWMEAMRDEMKDLMVNHTLSIILIKHILN